MPHASGNAAVIGVVGVPEIEVDSVAHHVVGIICRRHHGTAQFLTLFPKRVRDG